MKNNTIITHEKGRRHVSRDESGTTATTVEMSIQSSFNSAADSLSDFQPRMTRPMSTGNLMEIASCKQSKRRLTVRFKDEQQAKCRAWAEAQGDKAPTLPRSRSNEDFDNATPPMRKRSNSSDEIHYSPGRLNKKKLSIGSMNNALWYHKSNASSSSRLGGYPTQNAVWSMQSPRMSGRPNRLTVQALASPTSNRRALDIRNSRNSRNQSGSSSSDRTSTASSSSTKPSSKRRSKKASVDSVQDLLKLL